MKVDLLIKNGIVYDGTGAEPFEADIGVAGDKIAFINKVSGIRYQVSKTGGEKVIDAKGMAVSPGFIDTH
ncbi:MAG: N-acyl-D-aspartate deacylase, partial [Nitrospirae bacterium CG22_combo_CG10-13_8_21_14_all_44_11]